MRTHHLVCIGVFIALCSPTALRAQYPSPGAVRKAEDSPVVPGTRVRLTVPKALYWSLSDHRNRLVGTVDSLAADTLMLGHPDQATPLAIPIASISRLEISRGPGKSPLKSAGLGFLVGAGCGVVIGLADGDDTSGYLQLTAAEKALAAGLFLGSIGFVVGLIGGLITGGEQWETIADPFPGFDVGVSPQRRRVYLALSPPI